MLSKLLTFLYPIPLRALEKAIVPLFIKIIDKLPKKVHNLLDKVKVVVSKVKGRIK